MARGGKGEPNENVLLPERNMLLNVKVEERQGAARLDFQSMIGTPTPNPQYHSVNEPVRGPGYNPLFKC